VLSIDVGRGGLVTLRGTVPNEAARTKAGDLARQTVGVENVQNELKVAETRTQ
jgi:osmotically-inducible protein OsmY